MTTVNRTVRAVVVAAKSTEPAKPSSPASKWTGPADTPNDAFITGAAKFRTIANPKQTVKLERVTVPKFDYAKNKGVPLEVTVPLKSLDVSPLSHEQFANELQNAKVTLSAPWAVSDQPAKLSIVDGSLRLNFDDVSLNAISKVPPLVNVKMPGGQFVQLELRPRTVVLDTRAHELATRRDQLASVEAFISKNEFPAATQAMKESFDRQKSQLEEVRSRPFVGFTELTAYAER
ncbi:MAG: hypothetical protein ACO1OB_10300 [Archangium sp.]